MLLRVMGRGLGLLLTTLAIGLMCLSPIEQAFAHPRWTVIQTVSRDEIVRNGWFRTDENRAVLEDRRVAQQDYSALLLNIPPERYGGGDIGSGARPTTVVFGVYDPQTATGRITIAKGELLPDGQYRIATAPFKPTSLEPRGRLPIPTDRGTWTDLGIGDAEPDEVEWLTDYAYWNRGHPDKRMNPFADFNGHPDGMTFIRIQPSAFFAAVGWAATWSRAATGWIATLDQREEMRSKTSGNLVRKRVTYTKRVFVKPAWTLMVPGGVMNANAESYAFCFPAAECGDAYGRGRTSRARNMMAGWNFHHMGPGHNLPVDEILVFQHRKTQAGWTMLAMVVLVAVLVAVTAGAAAALGGPNLATAFGMAGTVGGQAGVGAAAAAGAGAGALVNFGWNYMAGVHSLTDTVNRVFASGKSDIDSMRGQTSEWDSRPATRALIEAGPLAVPGAIGPFFTRLIPGARFAAAGGGRRWQPGLPLPRPSDPYQGLPGLPAR